LRDWSASACVREASHEAPAFAVACDARAVSLALARVQTTAAEPAANATVPTARALAVTQDAPSEAAFFVASARLRALLASQEKLVEAAWPKLSATMRALAPTHERPIKHDLSTEVASA
jgi:hypothetical protein